MPVAWRAEDKLIRELDLAAPGDQISEAVQAEYRKLYSKQLPAKAIQAMANLSRIATPVVMEAAAALAIEPVAGAPAAEGA